MPPPPHTACDPGFYASVANTIAECLTCPSNSNSTASGLAECPCDDGYYRTPQEVDLPCTRELEDIIIWVIAPLPKCLDLTIDLMAVTYTVRTKYLITYNAVLLNTALYIVFATGSYQYFHNCCRQAIVMCVLLCSFSSIDGSIDVDENIIPPFP